jgi:HNH endonuclease
MATETRDRDNWVFTWNPETRKRQRWPPQDLLKLVKDFDSKGVASEWWSCNAWHDVKPGCRAYLLRQGKTHGIFGSGQIVRGPRRKAGGGPRSWEVEIEFDKQRPDHLVYPETSGFLVTEEQLRAVGADNVLGHPASGQVTFPPDVAREIDGIIDDLRLSNGTVLPDDDYEAEFPEGRELFLKHRARERNRAVVELAKSLFLRKHGRFFCQACGFDFERTYGDLGRGFIEAHHTIPVSELSAGSTTRANEIALICPNCHRMLHRKRPWLPVDELQTLLNR